jgi:TP901 family phage tail tape measure protein
VPDVATIRIRILGKDLFSGELKTATAKMRKFGQGMKNVGRGLTLGLTLPIAAMGISTLKTAGDFEAGMNRVQGLTSATAQEMSVLTKQARELGATTQFSASQATEAMQFLSMAGFQTEKIYKVMPDTLNLAAAGVLELGEAADIVSNIMTGFNKKPEELAHISDVLTSTFTSTNTNLQQLGEGMKFVAPIASAMGISLEETAAAMGLLGNAGIQASMAGTSLRGALAKLGKPTGEAVATMKKLGIKKSQLVDSAGNVRSFTEAVRVLETTGASAADLLTIFGQRAGPGMAALVGQGADALEKLTKQVSNDKGITGRIAAKNMEGFNGAMKEMKSAFQEVQIAIADSGLLEFVTGMVRGLTDFLRKLGETNPMMLKMGTILAVLVAAIGPLLLVLGQMLIMAAPIMAFFATHAAIGAFAAAIGAIALPVALVIAAFMIWSRVIQQVIDNWDNLKAVFTDFGLFAKTMGIFLYDVFLAPVVAALKFIGNSLKAVAQAVLPAWLEKLVGIGGGGAAPSAAALAEETFGGETTNNARVEVEVKGPAGTRASIVEGDNTTLRTDIGLIPAAVGG